MLMILTACGSNKGTKIKDELPQAKPATGMAGDGNLKSIVNYIRVEAGLPALAAVMVHDGEVIELAADGLRSIEDNQNVTTEDKWHLGSLTKSMTSTLAARLVRKGEIQWSTTISDVYPEMIGMMKPEYEAVRLDELLSHTSGMRRSISNIDKYEYISSDINTQRQKMVEDALSLSPKMTKGQYLYSNLGYMVAGAMLEKVMGNTWETLITDNVFIPLNMKDSHFGAPDKQGTVMQPVGHVAKGGGWEAVKVSASNIADNPVVLGPAGTVHASLTDMGHYLIAHLAGAKNRHVPDFLTAQEFKKLHTPMENSHYALGWGVGENFLTHNGSNTMWLATIEISADKNTAIFVVTNAADLDKNDSSAARASKKLLHELMARSDAAFNH
jgi:CubicO group peptidase (beta-lactamase class C family)